MSQRKELKTFASHVAEMAARKRDAAASHFKPQPPGAEQPRDVFLNSCEQLGEALAEHGFKYAKSGPHARRAHGDLTFEVWMQTSMNNVAGKYVELTVGTRVISKKLAAWRKRNPHRLSKWDSLFAGHLGVLLPDCPSLGWNLAPRTKRVKTLEDVIRNVEQIAFPHFARFENVDHLVPMLVNEEITEVNFDDAVEYFLATNRKVDAEVLCRKHLGRQPDCVKDYRKALVEYRRNGLPRTVACDGETIALLTMAHGLEV